MLDEDTDTLPVTIQPDRTVRVKVLDNCGLACTFCHNEGTAVTADNTPGRSTGRVSIYLGTNGASFLPARIEPGLDFAVALAAMKGTIETDEVHFTGGEPTLHPRLDDMVHLAGKVGLAVGITSNGENGAAVIPACAKAGLSKINFSVFGTTAGELASIQGGKYRSSKLADRKLRALSESIETAAACGVSSSANIVVPDSKHIDRALRLVEQHGHSVTVRLLNSLSGGDASINAVNAVLRELGAVPVRHVFTAGASGWRTQYELPDGNAVCFKRIRQVRLPETCTGCRFNNGTECEEGYYGIRLYRAQEGPFMVGVCIQRMDLCMTLGEFTMSRVGHEVRELRRSEEHRLRQRFNNRID